MKLIDKVFTGFIIIVIIFGSISFTFLMIDYDNKVDECTKEFGGKVVRGYCTYVKNGTSESYSIWEYQEEIEEELIK